MPTNHKELHMTACIVALGPLVFVHAIAKDRSTAVDHRDASRCQSSPCSGSRSGLTMKYWRGPKAVIFKIASNVNNPVNTRFA